MGRELRFTHAIDKSPVEDSAGSAQFRFASPHRGQNRPHLITPQEMCQHKGIEIRVTPRAPQNVEPHGAAGPPGRPQDTTPGWHAFQHRPAVTVGYHQCQLSQGPAVGLKLAREPPETVDGALDLVPVNDVVDHREIDAPPGMREAQFMDDQRVRVPHMAAKRLCQQSLPDGQIIQRCIEGALRTVPPYRCAGHWLVILPLDSGGAGALWMKPS